MVVQTLPFTDETLPSARTYKRDSQANAILQAMLKGRKLTCVDILYLGCLNAKGRISELRKAGHRIEDEWVKVNGARVKRYFIK